ncbi:hypothetical protein [Delftia sp. JD2]|uniref:hypothetical protein n=1 Tax=Delftia sp. JD2 TaxID=469553 RepID=UPI00080698AB|nr:hypothetical protein [Delftia sp. JD2]OBY86974.1 hypothetical protein ACM14_02235 [Delftia sp. JD2]
MAVYFHANSLIELDADQAAQALAQGFEQLKGQICDLPAGSIIVGSTNEVGGWTGVYRKEDHRQLPIRVARYRDFSRTLRLAQRLAPNN